MTTRETSFRENDHPGNDFPGKKQSGKVTIRETTVNPFRMSATLLNEYGMVYGMDHSSVLKMQSVEIRASSFGKGTAGGASKSG